MRLRDWEIIITGGSRGIGRAIAEACAREGANLVLVARDRTRLEQTCRELEQKYNVTVVPVSCDVRNLDCARSAVSTCVEKFGRIDVLVNNAGTAVRKFFFEMSPEEIDEIIDVNLRGLMYFALEALKVMIRQRRGIIINISSGAGKVGIPELAVYSATKAGVNIFTEALAREVRKFGIRVYAICPGGTDTDLHRRLFPEHKPEWLLKPEEVAELVLRLIIEGGQDGYCYDIYRLV